MYVVLNNCVCWLSFADFSAAYYTKDASPVLKWNIPNSSRRNNYSEMLNVEEKTEALIQTAEDVEDEMCQGLSDLVLFVRSN